MDKETKRLVEEIRTWQGWRIEETKKGWMVYPPNKDFSPVTIHKTPSDHRAIKNTRSELRKRGAPI